MDWVAVGKAAAAAAQAVYGYLQAQRDAAERNRKHRELLRALELARTSIVDALIALRRADLRGDVEGLIGDFETYDPDPTNAAEEGRLVQIIRDAAQILGDLGANIDEVVTPHDPPRNSADELEFRDLALESAALTIPTLYVRAQAMAERQATYGAPEVKDIHSAFDVAIPRFRVLAAYVHRESDRRFGMIRLPALRRDQSPVGLHWVFTGPGVGQFECGVVGEEGSYERCVEIRNRRMQAAYATYLNGAGPTLEEAVKGMERTLAQVRARPDFGGGTHTDPGAVTR